LSLKLLGALGLTSDFRSDPLPRHKQLFHLSPGSCNQNDASYCVLLVSWIMGQ
jgi:hypothetical protein